MADKEAVLSLLDIDLIRLRIHVLLVPGLTFPKVLLLPCCEFVRRREGGGKTRPFDGGRLCEDDGNRFV